MRNDLQQLTDALHTTRSELRAFEEQYQLSTDEFVSRYAAGEIAESLETIEWLGEYRMAQHIQEQIERSTNSSVEPALRERIHLLEVAIYRSESRLRRFEHKYGLATDDLLAKIAGDELQHTDDFDDWIGESRMLVRLREKLAGLQDVESVD